MNTRKESTHDPKLPSGNPSPNTWLFLEGVGGGGWVGGGWGGGGGGGGGGGRGGGGWGGGGGGGKLAGVVTDLGATIKAYRN